jgi:hypothetical protein
VYADGDVEACYTGVYSPQLLQETTLVDDIVQSNQSALEEILNWPGDAYVNYLLAVGRIEDAFSSPTQSPSFNTSDSGSMGRRLDNELIPFFDFVSDDSSFAYKIEDDYAILKINSFSVSYSSALSVWATMVEKAKARGLKKLLLDVSNNGGGFVAAGQALVVAMFPNVEFSLFEDNLDMTYNDLMVSLHVDLSRFAVMYPNLLL